MVTSAQLRAARSLLNLTVRELAEKAGVHRNTITRAETDETVHGHAVAQVVLTLEFRRRQFTNGGQPVRLRKVVEAGHSPERANRQPSWSSIKAVRKRPSHIASKPAQMAKLCEELLRKPIQGERGKRYHAIKCSDTHNCGDKLLLAEYSETFDESLDGDEVQCPSCKRITLIEQRRLCEPLHNIAAPAFARRRGSLHRLRHARKSVAKLRARFVPSRGQFSLAFRHFSPILGQFCERGEERIMQPIELGITG